MTQPQWTHQIIWTEITDAELADLIDQAQTEFARRQGEFDPIRDGRPPLPHTPALVRLIMHPRTESGRRQGWFKHVTSVDKTKKDGYAFEGDFLRQGEQDLPLGAIVVEQYPAGSVKHGYHKGEAFRVTADGLVSVAHTEDWRQQFLTFRDAVAAALEQA